METHQLFKKYFDKKKNNVHGFSIRSLAQRLDLSPSFLSRVLNGKKPIPHSLLIPLGKALDIEPEVFSGIQGAHQVIIPIKGKALVETQTAEWEFAESSSLRLLTQWYYIPIMDLTGLRDFDGSIEMISSRLEISPIAAEVAVRELIHLKCLRWEDGKLKKNVRKLRFSSSQSLSAIRSFHDKMLSRAKHELQNFTTQEDFERRLITGITVTAPKEKIEAAKRKLSECLHEIANDLSSEAGDEVYHLSAQFFPLTRSKK